MLVRADAVALADLPEVHGPVLVTQKRLRYILSRTSEFPQWRRNGVEMLHRRQWNGHIGQSANLWSPDASSSDN